MPRENSGQNNKRDHKSLVCTGKHSENTEAKKKGTWRSPSTFRAVLGKQNEFGGTCVELQGFKRQLLSTERQLEDSSVHQTSR